MYQWRHDRETADGHSLVRVAAAEMPVFLEAGFVQEKEGLARPSFFMRL